MSDREIPATSWAVWAWQAYRDGRLVEADRIEVLEAKLAKAVELAFDECPFRDGTGSYGDWWRYRRKELEALKG